MTPADVLLKLAVRATITSLVGPKEESLLSSLHTAEVIQVQYHWGILSEYRHSTYLPSYYLEVLMCFVEKIGSSRPVKFNSSYFLIDWKWPVLSHMNIATIILAKNGSQCFSCSIDRVWYHLWKLSCQFLWDFPSFPLLSIRTYLARKPSKTPPCFCNHTHLTTIAASNTAFSVSSVTRLKIPDNLWIIKQTLRRYYKKCNGSIQFKISIIKLSKNKDHSHK